MKMMGLAAAVAERPGEDHRRRVFGRMVIVYLGAFINPALELKNARGLKKTEGERLLHDLEKNYNDYYATIRHSLAAHRQDIDYVDMLDAWNAVDWTTTATFAGDAQAAWAALRSDDASLPYFAASPAVANPSLLTALVTGPQLGDSATLSLDNLSMTRGQIGFVPTHRVQTRGFEVVSVLDCIEVADDALIAVNAADDDLRRLATSTMLLDLCNLVDCVFGIAGGRAEAPEDSFLDILEEDGFGGAPRLRAVADALDLGAVGLLRAVRNKIVAHLEPNEGLADLLHDLDTVDGGDVNAVFSTARNAFYESCADDFFTQIFLIHGRQVAGLKVVPAPEVHKPYDN